MKNIKEKILNNQRINFEEALVLYNECEMPELGKLASHTRRTQAKEEYKNVVWWNTNMHLNPTNVCIGTCNFCVFAKQPKDPEAYTLSIEEALNKTWNGYQKGATEVHIVGGLNPKTLIKYYSELLRAIKNKMPQIHIKAFTAVEIDFFAKFEKSSYQEVIKKLIEAGLDSMPGGGAEVFAKSVRDETCPDKIPAEKWLEIHDTAHQLGLKSNATMLAGIGETVEERLEHMFTLREQQDKSKGFQTFIPLSCHYEGTDLLQSIEPLTDIEKIKNIALGRIILDNFPHIKAYWVQLGYKLAQVALQFGANDLDGTIMEEKITSAAGAKNNHSTSDLLQKLIKNAGFEPIERTTLYEVLQR